MLNPLTQMPPEAFNLIMFFASPPFQTTPDQWNIFDFKNLALVFAAISIGLIGILMAGAAFFGEQAEQAKRTWLPTTIQGLILVSVAGIIVNALAGTP